MNLTRASRFLLSPAVLLTLAAVIRIALAISMGGNLYFADTAEYEATARRFLHGSPLEATPRAPLYPALVALGFAIGGDGNRLMVRLLQVVLGVLVVALTGRVARALGGPLAERPALFAAALSPLLVFSSSMLYPTSLYTALLLGATAAALAMARRPTPARGALFGLLVPFGWMTDPVIVAPVGALIAGLLLRLPRLGRPLASSLAVAALTAAVIAVPYLQFARATYGGGGVFMAKAQYVLDWSRTDPAMAGTRRVRVPEDGEFKPLAAKALLAREWSLLREQPAAYVHDVGREFLHFFDPLPDRVQTQNRFNQPLVMWVGALGFAPILLLAIIGLLWGAGAASSRWTLASVILATAAFYSFFFTQARYRVPVEPLFIVLAALALARLMPRVAAFFAGGAPASEHVPASPTSHRSH